MKMFYIKPEMDIELVEVEVFLAQSTYDDEVEVPFDPDKRPDPEHFDAPEFTW